MKVIITLFLCVLCASAIGQISQGGTPYSIRNKKATANGRVDFASKRLALAAVNNTVMLENARKIEADCPSCKKEYYGSGVEASIDIKKDGEYHDLGKDGNMWLLTISSESALGMQFYFDRFHVPAGSALYFYNEDQSMILGSYTNANNHPEGRFATQIISGSRITMEYVESKDAEPALIHVYKIIHAFKDIYATARSGGYGDSGGCNIDINCPEGAPYQDVKGAICRISYFDDNLNMVGLCSGALMNTTSSTRKNYVLTAFHCISKGVTDYDPSTFIFEFGYEIADCNNKYAPISYLNTMNGATYLTKGKDGDYALLDLGATPPPASYKVVYLGWDRSGAAVSSVAGIHHPNSDVKKISIDTGSPTTIHAWLQQGLVWEDAGPVTDWKLNWTKGVTERGSSGSPLLNQNKLFIGQLRGGASQCLTDTPAKTGDDYYGRLAYSWSHPDPGYSPLSSYLDVSSTGASSWASYNTSNDFQANFTYTVDVSSPLTLHFADLSQPSGQITQWNWTFGDGSTSIVPYPDHTYAAKGDYTVTLKVYMGASNRQISKTISIFQIEANFYADKLRIRKGQSINFTDLSSPFSLINGWAWWFEQPRDLPMNANVVQNGQGFSYPKAQYQLNISHQYNTAGKFQVRQYVFDDFGNAGYSYSKTVEVNETPEMTRDFPLPPLSPLQPAGNYNLIDIAMDDNRFATLKKSNIDANDQVITSYYKFGPQNWQAQQNYLEYASGGTGINTVGIAMSGANIALQRQVPNATHPYVYRVVNGAQGSSVTIYPSNVFVPNSTIAAPWGETPQMAIYNNELIIAQREGSAGGFYLYYVTKTASQTWNQATVSKYTISNETGSTGKVFIDAGAVTVMTNGKINIWERHADGTFVFFDGISIGGQTKILQSFNSELFKDYAYANNTIIASERPTSCPNKDWPAAFIYEKPTTGWVYTNISGRMNLTYDPDINDNTTICFVPNSLSLAGNYASISVKLTNGGNIVYRKYLWKKFYPTWVDSYPTYEIKTIDPAMPVGISSTEVANAFTNTTFEFYNFADYCMLPAYSNLNLNLSGAQNDVVKGSIELAGTINANAIAHYVGTTILLKSSFIAKAGSNVTFTAVATCDDLYYR